MISAAAHLSPFASWVVVLSVLALVVLLLHPGARR